MSKIHLFTFCRHGAGVYLTVDGNHHANRYSKNSDPRDSSLLKGASYMPERDLYKKYVDSTECAKEVSLDNHFDSDTHRF